MLSILVQGDRSQPVVYKHHRSQPKKRQSPPQPRTIPKSEQHSTPETQPLHQPVQRPLEETDIKPICKSSPPTAEMGSVNEFSFWHRFATRTTMHGFSDLYMAKGWFAKVFWFVVLLGALIAVVYYNYTMVVQYLSKPAATLISYNDVDKMQFPNITVCSNEIFNATFVKNSLVFNESVKLYLQETYGFNESYIKTNFISYLMLQLLNYVPYNETTDRILISVMENVYESLINDSRVKDIFNFYYNAGFNCESFLVECVFAGKRYDCCKFARPVITAYGICYQLHFETDISQGAFQTVEGSDQGFVITTQVNQTWGVQADVAHRIDYSQEDGIRVHATDYVSLLDFNPMLIPSNMHATIRMIATQYSVNQDTDNCYDPSQTFKLAYREAYTPNLCRQECASNVSFMKCKCQDPTYYFTGTPDMVCTPKEMLTCIFPSMYGDNSTESTHLTQECINTKCFQTCQYWLYEPSVMYSSITVDPDGDPNTQTTKMTIYYSKMQYEAVEEQLLMNTETFVSNVGGICGLWIGMSLMSIVQFFYILLCRSCEKKQMQKMEQKDSK